MNKNVKILSVEAKDVITGKCTIVDKTSKKDIDNLREQGYRILNNYKGSMDYSLLIIWLQKNFKHVIKFNKIEERYYSNDIITVNFNYLFDITSYLWNNKQCHSLLVLLSISKMFKRKLNKIKNKIKGKIKRKLAKGSFDIDELNNLNERLELLNNKIASKNNEIQDKNLKIKDIKKEYYKSIVVLRNDLYKNGFSINVNGSKITYIRLFRSSGSARVGKVNFINKQYYDDIINWCMCGLDYKNSNELDLPSIEAYISLISSSIIDTFRLEPQNILLIDDATSTFTDTVMATELINLKKDKDDKVISGDLFTDVAKKEISNKLFDGESLLDKSIFEQNGYSDKAILQLRNRFYKGIGINTDIQKFFKNNSITSINQLYGSTFAKDIKDIKLITTKSSIKYLKYKTFEEWIKIMSSTWGICKYDKGQCHNFNGMVNTHYQLINTLGMDKEAVKELLSDTLHYIKLLKNDISVFKLHLGIIKDNGLDFDDEMTSEEVEQLDAIKTNSDFVLNMLKINENFAKTEICRKFRYEVVNNYIENVRKGHILVKGTYATVINSAYEYLLCSIGKWDGESNIIGKNECYTAKFEEGEDILGVRSPQPTMSNMTVFKNIKPGILEEYFNTKSKNVIYISAVGWNVLELESSMDMDGDSMLITDQKLITEHCKNLNEDIIVDEQVIKRFLVSTDFTPKKIINRKYDYKNLSDTDIKCSQGKIGECINFVQMLNSAYWTKKIEGASEEELLELYKDISNLNVLSCIIIDNAKKETPVNVKKEMDKIREKGYLGRGNIIREGKQKEVGIRPYFFKYLNGGKDYKFEHFKCGMDYLEEIISNKNINPRKNRDNDNGNVELKSLLLKQKSTKADRRRIKNMIDLIKEMQIKISNVYKSKDEVKDKFRQAEDIRQEYYIKLSKYNLTSAMIYTIVKRLSDSYSKENCQFEYYRKYGRSILKTLYSIDNVKFLSCFSVKCNITETIVRSEDGDVDIYGVKYRKIHRN